ncbi:cytochrome P450 [Lentinula detonsa]|uniref:Cytochrome P450 n=1 Tax=Lentinula detonsa TaxID=2804962 RepID=A0AA38UXU9_9AGAR|nr:cytochrome P450 [Lentinula detonsa]
MEYQTIALVASFGLSLCTYAIFKNYEPRSPTCWVIVLILLPITPAILVHWQSPGAFKFAFGFTASFSVYYTTLIFCTTAYRLSCWHPLAAYPGPLACKLSKLYMAYISQKEKQHLYLYNLHQKYGDIVRIGPNEVIIRSTDAITPLLGSVGLPKGAFWDGRFPANGAGRSLISVRNNKEHAVRRRPWNCAFSSTAIKNYEPLIEARTNELVDMLGRQTGTVDLLKWMKYFSYDIMTDFVFGGGTHMMRDGDVDNIWHQIESSQKVSLFLSHVPWLGQMMFRIPNLAKSRKAIMAYAIQVAEARNLRPSTKKDLYYYLFNEAESALRPLTKQEALSDSLLAIGAGADTTAASVSNIFYFLLTNPSAYNRLRDEIDAYADHALNYNTQAGMPYLNAVINENLRLLPAVPSGSVRGTTQETGGQYLGSYYIPPNTTVSIHFYSMHRDPRNFSLPDLFLPERWLSMEERTVLEPALFAEPDSFIHNPSAFIPFSYGPASCVGKNYAYLEMRMVVCKIMVSFDICRAKEFNSSVYEDSIKDLFTLAVGNLPVVLTSRP